MYLIENHLGRTEQKQPPKLRFKATDKEIKDVYRVFERFASGKTPSRTCRICGAPVENKRRCPNCHALTF